MKIIITHIIEFKPTPKPKKKKSPATPKREPSKSQKTINIITHN